MLTVDHVNRFPPSIEEMVDLLGFRFTKTRSPRAKGTVFPTIALPSRFLIGYWQRPVQCPKPKRYGQIAARLSRRTNEKQVQRHEGRHLT